MIVQTNLTWDEWTQSYVVKDFSLNVSVVEMLNISEGLSMVATAAKKKDVRNRAELMLEEIHKEMERHSEIH